MHNIRAEAQCVLDHAIPGVEYFARDAKDWGLSINEAVHGIEALVSMRRARVTWHSPMRFMVLPLDQLDRE